MSHPFDFTVAFFLGFVLEAFAFGINTVLFFMAVIFLWQRQRRGRDSRLMLFFGTLLYSCCATHFSLSFSDICDKLLLHPVPIQDITAFTPKLRAADIFIPLTDFFAQLVLIYRLFVIWNKSLFITALPLFLALPGLACALAGFILQLEIAPDAGLTHSSLVPLGDAALALAFCANFTVTALIVGRIWLHHRRHRKIFNTGLDAEAWKSLLHTDTYLQSVIVVVIESGGLYLALQFIYLVLFALKHPAQSVLSPITIQVYGIAPTLILVRVGLGIAETSPPPLSTFRGSALRSSLQRGGNYIHRLSDLDKPQSCLTHKKSTASDNHSDV